MINPLQQVVEQTRELEKTSDVPESADISLDLAAASGLNQSGGKGNTKRKKVRHRSKVGRETGKKKKKKKVNVKSRTKGGSMISIKRLSTARKNQSGSGHRGKKK